MLRRLHPSMRADFDAVRIVQRARRNKPQVWVLLINQHNSRRAAATKVKSQQIITLRGALFVCSKTRAAQLKIFRIKQRVNAECATGAPLAKRTVTRSDTLRLTMYAIPYRATQTTTFANLGHSRAPQELLKNSIFLDPQQESSICCGRSRQLMAKLWPPHAWRQSAGAAPIGVIAVAPQPAALSSRIFAPAATRHPR